MLLNLAFPAASCMPPTSAPTLTTGIHLVMKLPAQRGVNALIGKREKAALAK
jgi:hypothetical protein